MRGHCSRWRGWQGGWQNQGWGRKADGTRDVSKTRQLRSPVGMGAPGSCARLCWKDWTAQGRDSSFCGACMQAGAAGMPRGHVRAALQISKSHLADKNLFGPPSYYSVYPPSPAHPFPARQAPQCYPAAPIVTLFTTHGHLAGKLAQMPPQEWTPKVTATTRAQPDCQGSDTRPRLSSRRVPWALGEMSTVRSRA